MNNDKSNLQWVPIVLVAAVVIAGIYIFSKPGQDRASQSGSDVQAEEKKSGADDVKQEPKGEFTERVIESDTFKLSNNFEYSLERFAVIDAAGNTTKIDQRLVSRAAGKRAVVIPSIKAALPELGRMGLRKFVVRQLPELIVFVSIFHDTDAPYGAFYRFDLPTKKFTKLSMASRFLPHSIHPDDSPALFSPDKIKFLSLRDRTSANQMETHKLYLVDVENDQARVVAEVSTNQSLTKAIGFGSVPVGEYNFVNRNTLVYSVYNPSDALTGTPRIPLEVRTTEVNFEVK